MVGQWYLGLLQNRYASLIQGKDLSVYVIIVGCGALGAKVAELLAADKHNVVVIDKNKRAFDRLSSRFNGVTYVGNGIDIDVQRAAGAERADAFAGLTCSDNANLMAAQVARNMFAVPKVLARLTQDDKQEMYEKLGIQVVSPVAIGAMQVRNRLVEGAFRRYLVLDKDGIELIRARIRPGCAGKRVVDLQKWGKLVISLIIRGETSFVPDVDTVFESGDQVLVTVSAQGLSYARRLFVLPDWGGGHP